MDHILSVWSPEAQTADFPNLIRKCFYNDRIIYFGPEETTFASANYYFLLEELVQMKKEIYNKHLKIVLVFNTSNPRPTNKHGRTFLIDFFTDLHNDNPDVVEIIEWRTFWFLTGPGTLAECSDNQTDFKYFLHNKNHNMHLHRCTMVDYLAKYGFMTDQHEVTWLSGDRSKKNGTYHWRWWEPKYRSAEFKEDDEFNWHYAPPGYDQSLIELVSESSSDRIFFTEKTARPILFKRPFIVCGTQGYNRSLETFGFKLYDNIFDYSFDMNPDLEQRCEAIASQLRDLREQDFNEIYQMTREIAQHNQDLLVDMIDNYENYLPDGVKDLLEEHKNHQVIQNLYSNIENSKIRIAGLKNRK